MYLTALQYVHRLSHSTLVTCFECGMLLKIELRDSRNSFSVDFINFMCMYYGFVSRRAVCMFWV